MYSTQHDDYAIYTNIIKFIRYRFLNNGNMAFISESQFNSDYNTYGRILITVPKLDGTICEIAMISDGVLTGKQKFINDIILAKSYKGVNEIIIIDNNDPSHNTVKGGDIWLQYRYKTIFYTNISDRLSSQYSCIKMINTDVLPDRFIKTFTELNNLPVMLETDPIATWYGLKAKNIIQMTRLSDTACHSIIYKYIKR